MGGINRSALLVIILILIAIGGYIYLNPQNETNLFNSPPTNTNNTSETEMESGQVPNNWQTLNSSTHGFTVRYPPDIQVIEQPNDMVTLVKVGPTQTEATEFYDGINLNFNSGSYSMNAFQDFIQNRHNELKTSPAIDNVTDIIPITITNLNGYRFNVTGLGTFTYIYLPKNQNQYLEIINATADPTRQGFQQTVDKILSTLTIL